ncbi:MAG: [protein-PII] uridylyltransferase [Bryobacteraceae bacterium]
MGKPLSNTVDSAAPPVLLDTGDAGTRLAERSAHVDRQVSAAAAEILFPAFSGDGPALVAVGGYGRRQMFPYSDVDLLLLFRSTEQAVQHKSVISAFLQQLWDSGLRMSHSVRTPEECAEVYDQNTELNISLLDQRYLAGDRALYASLAAKLPRFVLANRDALARNLARLTRERHAKYGETIYHLEPNVKETPGGLRDFQLFCWLEQLRNTDSHRLGLAAPPAELEQAFRHLARLRTYLHAASGRDNNMLSFEAQDSVAEQAGAADTAEWMREYFRHARAIHRAAIRQLEITEAQNSGLLASFRDWRSRLGNAEFSVHRERVHVREASTLDADPGVMIRLFEFVARHGMRPSAEAEQQIAARLPRLREHFMRQPVWRALEPMFSLEHAPLAVRAMHDTGVLTALFPELAATECLVIRDFYHRYTVDEHTLVAMQNVWNIQGPYKDLRSEVKQPALLLLAMLFHDSGKGWPDEGHVDGSLRLVRAAAHRIGMPDQDRETVFFLIARHLELSATMHSRDVFDPATIAAAASMVETVERLKLLTLLTYGDISAVNPTAMTPWRSDHLWQLYLAVYNELTRGLQTDRIEPEPTGPPKRIAFLAGFPKRYLRTHSEAEIDEHMALAERSRPTGIAVDIRKLDSAWQLTLVTADRPGLFASLAGTLSSFGMNIVRAEAFSNRHGTILDTFTFEDPLHTLDLNSSEVERLAAVVERVLAGKTDVRQLLRNRPKAAPPTRKSAIAGRVSFHNEASQTATLVEIVAQDRPGLLYALASALSDAGANIEVVLIDTEAHKAIDVFYVTSLGSKLNAAQQAILGEKLRRACAPA